MQSQGRATRKRDCCAFWEADGTVHQMDGWGSNKVADLEASRRTVNTANSRIGSAQMFP